MAETVTSWVGMSYSTGDCYHISE